MSNVETLNRQPFAADPFAGRRRSAAHKTINAWCRNSGCAAEIRVYAVTDAEQQNAIIRWIEDFKAHGQVNRPVRLRFYERENMIYMPGNKPGFWGWRRGPEKIVRTVTL
jgi:hypothetical protein